VVLLGVLATLVELADSTFAVLAIELDASAETAEKADVNTAVPYTLIQ
jgi:hypothetical protein